MYINPEGSMPKWAKWVVGGLAIAGLVVATVLTFGAAGAGAAVVGAAMLTGGIVSGTINALDQLHDGEGIDMSEWTTSKKAAKLVYAALKEYDKHYGKKKYDCDKYLSLVSVALRNVKKYCVDINHLDKNIGSNMPELFGIINEM